MSTAPCAFCGADYPGHDAACPACGMALVAPTRALPPGTTLQDGRFAVGQVLGEGGFGITYQGVHKPLQRVVAIKELFPADAQRQDTRVLVPQAHQLAYRQAVAAALQEARHIARLQAPGIVAVFDTFRENGTVYIVMEYLEGQTLGDRIREQGPLPPATVRDLALEICDALAVLHAQQLLHRDLKPENLLLTRDERTVLIDFGSARPYQTDRTMPQTRILTEDYAAPEQYSARGRFGPYTDIFALGATLFHALTGAPPPRAIDRLQDPDLVPRLPADIGPEWTEALDQTLRLRVEERPQTVAAFRQLLAEDVSEAVVPGSPAPQDCTPDTDVAPLGGRSGWPALMASGGSHTVQLWDVASGQCRHTLKVPKRWVWTVAFSPDGHTLASGGEDRAMRLWDVASGQCRHMLRGHTHVVWTVAFSPDGHILASGGPDGVRLWEVVSGQCRYKLERHRSVKTVAFSPDGYTLASGSLDGTVRLWAVASGQCRHTLVGHEEVHAVAFSPDGHTLASGEEYGTVQLWDVASRQCRHTLVGHEDDVQTVTFSPDGHTLASGSRDDTVRLWDVASGQCRHTLVGHEKVKTVAVAFSPDGHTLASGDSDGIVRLWDVASGQCRHTLVGHTGWVLSMAFSPY